jgi:predicted transcriptional regulator YdeE
MYKFVFLSMESKLIQEDIPVFYVEASSFPTGISAAFEQLFSQLPDKSDRRIFGISRPENGKIVYRAAAEITDSEEFDPTQIMLIPKGEYAGVMVQNFQQDVNQVGMAFQKLTSLPSIDPNGYCIEWYQGQSDVLCLVRLNLWLR